MALKPTPASPWNVALAALLALVLVMGSPAWADRTLAQAHLQRAVALQAKGKIAEADLEFQNAVTADPKWDKAHASRASFYMGRSDFANAVTSWRKAVALAPKNAGYREKLATSYMAEKKWDQASEAWVAFGKLRPQDSKGPYNLALIAFEKGNLDKAESFLTQANKIVPGSSEFVLLQARIDIKREQYDTAAGRLRPLVDTLPPGLKPHEEAQALLDEVEGVLRGKKIQVGLMIGVPIVLVVLAFALLKFMRRVDIKAPPTRLDPSSAESICRYVLDHVAAITGLPRGLCWSAGLDGQNMELQASELMGDPGPLDKRKVDREALDKWIEAHGGGPFLYKVEVKEPFFLQAFPGLVADLGSVEMNVGVPLMWKGSFRGLLLLGRSRSAGKMDLRNRFEKNAVRIQEVAEQGAQALDQLHKENMQVVDVETGVWNREYYDRTLAEALQGCRTAGLPLALYMVRMDAFDEIHERYGEKMSGEILTSLVQALQEALRQEVNTTLCRLEGGVFGVLAPERGLREAPSLAQKLKAAVDGLKISRNLPKPTGCVAYGVFPDHADEANSLRRTTSRAFRDAVYLEGNRILEAERGGAMDKDDEIEPGRKASGRRALTGEPEVAPPPAPEPTGPKPFMPFTTARPKAEASPPASEEEEEVAAPVRSRFGVPAAPPPAPAAPAPAPPAPAASAPAAPAPAPPAPVPSEVPQADTPRSTPASLGRIGRLGLGAAAAAGEKSNETRILPRPSTPAASSEGPAAAARKPLPRFGASGRSIPAPTPPAPPEEASAPAPRPTPRLAAPAGKGAPPPPVTEPMAEPAPKTTPEGQVPSRSADEAPSAPTGKPAPVKPDLPSSETRLAVPPAAKPELLSSETRPAVPPAAAPAKPELLSSGSRPAVPSAAAAKPELRSSGSRPAVPAAPSPARPAAASKPAAPPTPASRPAAPPAALTRPGVTPASGARPVPPAAAAKPAAPPTAPSTPVATPAALAGTAKPTAPSSAPASPAVPAQPTGVDEPGIDPDTQFATQETFEDLAVYEVRAAGEAGEPCSILYLRLANLQELQSAGQEEYLRARRDVTSLIMDAFVRDGVDFPGLVGPDDFALLLTGTDLATACGLARQVTMTVRNLQVGGHKVSPAVGVASFPDDPVDGRRLIEHAREAARSGDGVRVYGSGS